MHSARSGDNQLWQLGDDLQAAGEEGRHVEGVAIGAVGVQVPITSACSVENLGFLGHVDVRHSMTAGARCAGATHVPKPRVQTPKGAA